MYCSCDNTFDRLTFDTWDVVDVDLLFSRVLVLGTMGCVGEEEAVDVVVERSGFAERVVRGRGGGTSSCRYD